MNKFGMYDLLRKAGSQGMSDQGNVKSYINNQKLLVWLFVVAIAVNGVGCRRRNMSGPAPTVSAADTITPQTPAKPADTIATNVPTSASVASTSVATPTPKSPRPGIDEARTNVAEIDFRFLTAKAKVSFKSKDQDIDNATVNIRVKKDSLIWIAVSKVGIEAARVLITRDSVTILDKVHSEYTQYDFPSLSQQFNFDMNFELLQALIVGNLPLPKQPAQKIKNERDYLLLRQNEGKVLVENYIGEEDRKLKKLMVVEQPTKNTLRLDYKDFTALNNFLFPYTSLITLDYKSGSDGQFYQTLLQVRHSKVELVDKNPGFPFSIPAKYTRRP